MENSRCTIRNCPHLEMVGSSLPDKRVYDYGLHLSGEDFYNKRSFFASNDLLMSEFINDDLLSALEVSYEGFRTTILLRGGVFFFVNELRGGDFRGVFACCL